MSTQTEAGGSTATLTDLRTEPTTGKPEMAHIVHRQSANETAVALVMRARVEGFAVEALCGFVWIPSKDPKHKPVCSECAAIYDLYGDFGDTPGRDPRELDQ